MEDNIERCKVCGELVRYYHIRARRDLDGQQQFTGPAFLCEHLHNGVKCDGSHEPAWREG